MSGVITSRLSPSTDGSGIRICDLFGYTCLIQLTTSDLPELLFYPVDQKGMNRRFNSFGYYPTQVHHFGKRESRQWTGCRITQGTDDGGSDLATLIRTRLSYPIDHHRNDRNTQSVAHASASLVGHCLTSVIKTRTSVCNVVRFQPYNRRILNIVKRLEISNLLVQRTSRA